MKNSSPSSQNTKSVTPKPNWDRVSYYVGELSLNSENTQLMTELKFESQALQEEVFSLLSALQGKSKIFDRSPVPNTLLSHIQNETDLLIPFASGEIVNKYKLIRQLGEGAFSKVFLAEDTHLERLVAVKISTLKSEEAQLLAQLNHPHIVTVFESLQHTKNSQTFFLLIMTYIKGQHLDEYMVHQKKEACIDLFIKLVAGLKEAHLAGVLHLDVKPNNILVDSFGHPHLMDFNISLRTKGRPLGGTSKYMSPEQTKALYSQEDISLDGRTDIYSLGRVFQLFEVIPFFALILEICVKKNPHQRWRSTAELSDVVIELKQQIARHNALPQESSWIQFWQIRPALAALVFGLLPQVLGSLFNIIYNKIFIVSSLSPQQVERFASLVLIYNLVAYSLVGWLIVSKYLKLSCRFNNTDISEVSSSEYMEMLTKRGLLLQDAGALKEYFIKIISLGWLPGVLFFPYFMNSGHEQDYTLFIHFAISILSSWLMAASFSYLALQSWYYRIAIPNLIIVKDFNKHLPPPVAERTWVYQLLGSTPLLLLLGSSLMIHFYNFWPIEKAAVLHFLLATFGLIGLHCSFSTLETIQKYKTALK